MNRRRFLGLAAGAVAFGACGDTDASSLQRRLRAFLPDPDGAARLGASVDRAALGLDPYAWFRSVDDPGFASHARSAVAGDLAADRFVEVDGWLLARTEATLCALAADVL